MVIINGIDTKALECVSGAEVLLVEDNEINQKVASELLQQAHIKVFIANNGYECVKMVEKQPFDLVLMDIQMPGMDGYEATQILKEKKIPAPIVAMTAHAMVGEREKCLQAGMDDYIPKPIDPVNLYAKLIKWISPRDPAQLPVDDQLPEPALECTEPVCLPEVLPGIDIETGLLRVGQNKSLYHELLVSFREKYADLGRELARELGGMNYETAGRLVHTVKGMSGNLGANDLYKAAVDLETGILKGRSQDLSPLLNAFKAHLVIVTQGLSQLDEKIPASVEDVPAMDAYAVKENLKQLEIILESDYIAATDLLKSLAPSLETGEFSHLFSDLSEQVESFDTQRAEKTLSQLIRAVYGDEESGQ